MKKSGDGFGHYMIMYSTVKNMADMSDRFKVTLAEAPESLVSLADLESLDFFDPSSESLIAKEFLCSLLNFWNNLSFLSHGLT